MEKLDSGIVTLVLKMKEIVILMMYAKMVFYVDQTIAQLHSVLTLKLIVVTQMQQVHVLLFQTFLKLIHISTHTRSLNTAFGFFDEGPGILEAWWYTGRKIHQILAEWAVCARCHLQIGPRNTFLGKDPTLPNIWTTRKP